MRGIKRVDYWVLILAVASVTACATHRSDPQSHDRVISRLELNGDGEASVRETIGRLRPGWLGPSNTVDPGTQPAVYMNRLYLGDASALSSVRSRDVVEVRLIPPSVAQARYGADNPAGVIELVTKDLGAY